MGNIIIKVLGVAVKAISPELRSVLQEAYLRLKGAAKDTATPWDDLFVEVLGVLLGFEELS